MVEEYSTIYLKLSSLRELTQEEKKVIPEFKYVTLNESIYNDGETTITVPKGFLTDGSSGPTPDWGRSWLFHDWLYAVQKIDNGNKITRDQADAIYKRILIFENLNFASWLACKLFKLNPFWVWSRAWRRSGERGAKFYNDYI